MTPAEDEIRRLIAQLAAANAEIERLRAVIKEWGRLSGGPGPEISTDWSNPPTYSADTGEKT